MLVVTDEVFIKTFNLPKEAQKRKEFSASFKQRYDVRVQAAFSKVIKNSSVCYLLLLYCYWLPQDLNLSEKKII